MENMKKKVRSDEVIIGEIVKAITGKNFHCVVLQEGENDMRAIEWATGVHKGALLTYAVLQFAKSCGSAKEFTMKMAKLTAGIADDKFDLASEFEDDDAEDDKDED